jgi:putative nucleotidyltransferase with HDIG domain
MYRKDIIVNQAENLRQKLKNLDSLPAIPNIALKILSLKLNNDKDDLALLELIVQDPPIIAKIIGLSNSPLFNTGQKITKLDYAVALLGSRRVKMIAISFSMISSVARRPAGLLNTQSLWKHSLAIAMTMDTLARFAHLNRCPPDDEIYLAGLLHDIGFLVLDYLDPQLSDKFHAQLEMEPNTSMQEIEEEMLGIDHGELGALLGRHWNLPEPIIASMNHHHTPDEDQTAVARPLVALANLAERMLPTFGFAESVRREITDKEWQSLGIDPLSADEIKAKVQKIILEVSTTKF